MNTNLLSLIEDILLESQGKALYEIVIAIAVHAYRLGKQEGTVTYGE